MRQTALAGRFVEAHGVQRMAAVRVLVLVGVLTACAHRPAAPTCGAGWAPLSERRGSDASWAAPDRDRTISSVAIAGVEPTLRATLVAVLGTKRGQRIAEAPLADDLRRLWGLGVISDAQIELDGGVVTFAVTPRERVSRVVFAGTRIKRFELLPGAPYEPVRLRRIARTVELGYIREGHLDAQIAVEQARGPHGVEVCVAARPGPRVTISSVTFPGRHRVPEAGLRAAIHGEPGGVNHVGGTYDADALASDEVFLTSTYYDVGSIDVKIGTPRVIRHGPQLELQIPIVEGPQYRIGAITSPVPLPAGVRRGDVFSRKRIVGLRDQLAKATHATVEIATQVDVEHHRIDLAFEVQWRWPWDAWRPWLVRSR
jgi:outer membrane protein insertion porin family